jgi:hypothetical protein
MFIPVSVTTRHGILLRQFSMLQMLVAVLRIMGKTYKKERLR